MTNTVLMTKVMASQPGTPRFSIQYIGVAAMVAMKAANRKGMARSAAAFKPAVMTIRAAAMTKPRPAKPVGLLTEKPQSPPKFGCVQRTGLPRNASMAGRLKASSSDTKLMLTPVAPARPVRPMRWT